MQFEREIVPRGEPAVLRGLLAGWPAVQRGAESDRALCEMLEALDSGQEVDALMLPPQHRGRIFYADEGPGFNYLRNRVPLSRVIEQLQRYALFPDPPAVAVQSALAAVCVPAFTAAHPMPLLDASVQPRLWLGNQIRTPTHFDESSNIACVVAGERCFTLFAPEQIGNLYIGPIGNAPTGTPISMVDPETPDLQRFPRFAEALGQARRAVLGPGDAIYIPPLWWHHVASRTKLNLLVNYWWSSTPGAPSALDALVHALLALRALPPQQRRAWRTMFDHWIFEANDHTVAHLPPELRGMHGEMTPELATELRASLMVKLTA